MSLQSPIELTASDQTTPVLQGVINPNSQHWRVVAISLIGVVALILGISASVGLATMLHSIQLPTSWFTELVHSIGNTSHFWSLWLIAVGGCTLGASSLGYVIYKICSSPLHSQPHALDNITPEEDALPPNAGVIAANPMALTTQQPIEEIEEFDHNDPLNCWCYKKMELAARDKNLSLFQAHFQEFQRYLEGCKDEKLAHRVRLHCYCVAAALGTVEILKFLEDQGVNDLDFHEDEGIPADDLRLDSIHSAARYAIYNGNNETLRHLLERYHLQDLAEGRTHYRINQHNNKLDQLYSLLHLAAWRGTALSVKMLLDFGADTALVSPLLKDVASATALTAYGLIEHESCNAVHYPETCAKRTLFREYLHIDAGY